MGAVFNVGGTYNFDEHWGLTAAVTYIPLKSTSTMTIKAADGTVLSTRRPSWSRIRWCSFWRLLISFDGSLALRSVSVLGGRGLFRRRSATYFLSKRQKVGKSASPVRLAINCSALVVRAVVISADLCGGSSQLRSLSGAYVHGLLDEPDFRGLQPANTANGGTPSAALRAGPKQSDRPLPNSVGFGIIRDHAVRAQRCTPCPCLRPEMLRARSAAVGVPAMPLAAGGLRPAWGSFNSGLSEALSLTHMALAGSNGQPRPNGKHRRPFDQRRVIDCQPHRRRVFGYFLSLGQK